jgi:ribosomal subunit interface protein
MADQPSLKYQVTTRNCELTESAQGVIEHGIKRLERHLKHFDPDLTHLDLVIERHARREEYTGSVRLNVISQALPAGRNTGPTMEALLRSAFEDIEEQLSRYKSKLRREHTYDRQGVPPSPEPGQ